MAILVEKLASDDEAARQRAEDELVSLGAAGVPPVFAAFLDSEGRSRGNLRKVLIRFGPDGIRALYDESEKARQRTRSHLDTSSAEQEALDIIAAMDPEGVLPGLEPLLAGSYATGRPGFAVGVLMRMGPVGISRLGELTRTGGEAAIRSSAAVALGQLPDPRAAMALRAALESPEPGVRSMAAYSLGHLRDQQSKSRLLQLLSDGDESVRVAAATGLCHMYEGAILRPLVRVARSGAPSVREAASRGLMESTDPVARRLGKRYRPLATDPGLGGLPALALIIVLAATLGCLYAAFWAGAALPARLGSPRATWVALCGAALLGLYWGRFAVRISLGVEWVILFLIVPTACLIGFTTGPNLRWLAGLAGAVLVSLGVVALAPMLGIVYMFLLSFAAPAVAVTLTLASVPLAWFFGRRASPDARAPFRRMAAMGTAAFYVAYGIGYLWLWGGR